MPVTPLFGRGGGADDKHAALFERGCRLVEEGDLRRASAIARKLERARYSGAFDLAARVHVERGDIEAAIAELERGVREAPEAWLLWQALGSHRSDAGDHDAALQAYEQALACPGAWRSSVRLNQAILANRNGAHEIALERLDDAPPDDPDIVPHLLATKFDALVALGRTREAAATVRALEQVVAEQDGRPDGDELRARVHLARAELAAARDASADQVRRHLEAAHAADPGGELVLWHLREHDGGHDPSARMLRLLVEFTCDEAAAPEPGWRSAFGTYDVRATDETDAIGWIRRLERARLPVSIEMRVDEVDDLPNAADLPSGVYAVSPWMLFADGRDA